MKKYINILFYEYLYMIYCEYYSSYYGPELFRCILNGKDVTNLVSEKYGLNNWCERLWTFQEVFGADCLNKNFRCEFISDDRKHWFEGNIEKLDNFFNVPLHTPINQNRIMNDYVMI